MGNYRFRLSDMMPNAWFYKLKDMGKPRNPTPKSNSLKKKHLLSPSATSQPTKPNQPSSSSSSSSSSYPRKSYYFTRDVAVPDNPISDTHTRFIDPPRKSSKQRLLRRKSSPKKLVSSSVSAPCSCRATIWTKSSDSPPDYSASSSNSSPDSDDSFPPEFRSDQTLATESSFDKLVASWSSCNDIIIDVDKKSLSNNNNLLDLSDLDLPPIITKPAAKFDERVEGIKKNETTTKYRKSSAKFQETNSNGSSLSVKVVREESVLTTKQHKTSSFKRHSLNSPGLKLRVNSPRIANKKIQAHRKSTSSSRRSLSDSLTVVKSSFDPQRDFRESMVEMIVENNIRASKDLEDLLACYLSLNSDEYHDLIIKVFKQIWFDLNENKS